MRSPFHRVSSGVTVLAVAASLAFHVPPAHALGTLSGSARIRAAGGGSPLASGDSGTTFTLRLPPGASCPGDGTAGYRWQTYMVPAVVNPNTLTFGSNGPLPPGTGASFRQPLFTSAGGSPVVNQFTAAADVPGGPGLIVNIPDVNLAVFGPGIIPSGVYNLGVACTLGPADADQMLNFWNVQVTITAPGGGPSAVDWAVIPTAPIDFDGDGDTDRSVFRNGAWFAEGQATGFLGASGDIPVPADYDGSGDTDRAVYRNGAWFVEGQPTVFLGVASDIPVPGDYDGDGDAERAIYRPSVGGWYVDGQATVFFGLSSDIPVPADYDDDGDTDRAIFRPSVGGWYVDGQATVFLGLNGDIPVPGDYNGNGTADRAIWRPSVGGWYVQGLPTVFLGLNGDIPVPGDYNGNDSTDRGIWRPGVGGWYVDGQPTVFLGLNGDIPLPLPQAIYRVFF